MALSVGILPSLAIGACAYGAGELLLHEKKSEKLKESNKSLYDMLVEAKDRNRRILEMAPKVEDSKLRDNIKEINQTVNKIISTIEKKPDKYKHMGSFFDYELLQQLFLR